MSDEIKWVVYPPTSRHRYGEFTKALRENPGRWAKAPGGPHHQSVSQSMRNGSYAAFRPAGAFEVTQHRVDGVKVDIYVRYMGEPDA